MPYSYRIMKYRYKVSLFKNSAAKAWKVFRFPAFNHYEAERRAAVLGRDAKCWRWEVECLGEA